jgi:hypothetical protein
MKQQGSAEIILRFLRTVLLTDVILAVIVGVITLLLDLHTVEAYGTLLVWAGVALMILSAVLGIGGLSSRMEDVGAYSLSGAGNMSENLRRIAESGQSSLGCFSLLLVAGIVLAATGYILQIISTLFG